MRCKSALWFMEHEISKQHMDTLKALADTNVKISEAKALLENLKSQETTYLEEREKQTMEVIEKCFAQSEDLVQKIKHNYEDIQHLFNTATSHTHFLSENYKKFNDLLDEFNKKSQIWEKRVAEEEEKIADMRKQIEIDSVKISEERKVMDSIGKQLAKEKTLIESRQAQLKAALSLIKK